MEMKVSVFQTVYDGFAENGVGGRLDAWHGRRYGRENTQTWTDDKLCLMPSCTELRCLWLVSTCRVHAYMHAVHGRSLKVSLWI